VARLGVYAFLDMGGRLLILLLDGATRDELETAVEEHGDGYPTIYVVAPANVGTLDWLATDERRAHGEAGARVLEAEWLLEGSGEVSGEAGESDPVLAVEDALRHFEADEIVVVGAGGVDEDLLSSLRETGLPVGTSGLDVQPSTIRTRTRSTARALRSGRSAGTPWVAFIGANLGLLLIGVVISLVGMAIVWLLLEL
jgi:hypothetical protein